MTAPDARQSDELREALAEALRRVAPTASVGTGYERIADALLPVVTAWAEKQAAARAAATFDSEDVANTVRALADDLLTRFADDGEVDVHDVYDWWVYQAAALAADDRTDPA